MRIPESEDSLGVLDVRRSGRHHRYMDAVEGFQGVVDRLHEWFFELDRSAVEGVLRDETLAYQARLRTGVYGPAAEHGAFARLQEMRDRADAALLLDSEAA